MLYKLLGKKHKFRYPRVKRKRQYAKKQAKPKISNRSEETNNRKSFGHYDGDLIMFRNTKTNLITLRERSSRYLFAADITAKNIVKYMKRFAMKSLTLDNEIALE